MQLRISISGDQQSEAENRDEIHYSKGIQGEQTACGEDAVYYIHHCESQGKKNDPYYQKGYELAQYKLPLLNRRYINLLDSAYFLFFNYIES